MRPVKFLNSFFVLFYLFKLNTTVHERVINRYFESHWLVFTTSEISPVTGRIENLVSAINMDGVAILELQRQKITPRRNPVIVINHSSIVAIGRFEINSHSKLFTIFKFCNFKFQPLYFLQ